MFKYFSIIQLHDIDRNQCHGYIYVTINKLNGMRYVGQHTKWNKLYIGSGSYLKRAILKYGRENFESYIIDASATNQKELNEKEEYYINEVFDAVKSPDWYNIKDGSQQNGNCFAGLSDEERIKISEKFRKSYKERIARGGKYPAQGLVHSTETRMKISKSLKGRKVSSETGEKISKAISGDNHWTNRIPHSKESNELRSKKLRGEGNHNVVLFTALLPTGEEIEAYGMNEMNLRLLEFGYNVPARSINSAAKGKSKVHKPSGIKFDRKESKRYGTIKRFTEKENLLL